MTAPSVSVLIPVYNRSGCVGAAIESVLAQSLPDFELLVVDDGSTDGSPAVVEDFARRDPRVVPMRNPGRPGPASARNAGLRRARGEFVAFLDSDDVWMPDALSVRLEAIRGGAILAGGDYLMRDRASGTARSMTDYFLNEIVAWWERDARAARVLDGARLRADRASWVEPRAMRNMLVGGFHWLTTSAAMVRRDALEAAGGFCTRRQRTEDLDLWVRLMDRGRFVFCDALVADCDITGRSAGAGERYAGYDSERRFDAYREAWHHLAFLRELAAGFDGSPDERAFIRQRIASLHRQCGFHAGPERPWRRVWHHANAVLRSAEQRAQFRGDRRTYLANPW